MTEPINTQSPILILARTPLDAPRIAIARRLLENPKNRLVLLGGTPSWEPSSGGQIVRVDKPTGNPDVPEISWSELYASFKEFPRILTLS
ncbi:MAG: hypothetical protein ACYCTV_02560 [Leptospirales bacterium]